MIFFNEYNMKYFIEPIKVNFLKNHNTRNNGKKYNKDNDDKKSQSYYPYIKIKLIIIFALKVWTVCRNLNKLNFQKIKSNKIEWNLFHYFFFLEWDVNPNKKTNKLFFLFFLNSKLFGSPNVTTNYWLIDWLVFYTLSAVSQPK